MVRGNRTTLVRLLFLVAGVVLPAATTIAQQASSDAGGNASRRAGEIVIERASIPSQDGKVEFELGTLYVPENRAEPNSRIIGVGFARFRPSEPTGAPPVFLLPGGPASSFLSGWKAGDNSQRLSNGHPANFLRPAGDVVVVDQRGFSERGEILKVKFRMPDFPLDQPYSLERNRDAFLTNMRAAVEEFSNKGVDLRGYTVLECADDVDDLRKALGYDKISLMGQSFGSQWSFALMRRRPQIVERALLAGVEPLNHGYDMPSHRLAAIQRRWREAESDPAFKPYLPPGGLMGAVREVVDRLKRAPVQVQLKSPDATATVSITLGLGDFQRIFGDFSSDEGPAALLAIYYERYDAWATRTLRSRNGRDAEAPLIGPLIDSSLGVTPKREFLLRNDPANEFFGPWSFDAYIAAAEILPSPDVGDDFRTEVLCEIPVVFIHGDCDLSTPFENTLHIATFFPNSRVLTVENGGHGTIGPISRQEPQVATALIKFLRDGTMTNLPARVTLPAPHFKPPDFPLPEKNVGTR